MEEKKKSKKKELLPPLVLLIIVIIAFSFISIKIPYTMEEPYYTNITVEHNETYYREEPEKIEKCEDVEYLLGWGWRGWHRFNDEKYMSPVLEIWNHEIRQGTFGVQFGFFDEDEKPEAAFGEPLDFEDADFYSKSVNVTILPDMTETVIIRTLKPDMQKQYWAIADIRPPSYESCYSYFEENNETMVYRYNVTREVKRLRKKTRKISMFEFLFNRP